MVFVPYKQQPNQVVANSLPGSSAALYSAANSQQAGAAVTAPEPYQILMPVQMADGRMLQMPPEQAKVRYCVSKATYAWSLSAPEHATGASQQAVERNAHEVLMQRLCLQQIGLAKNPELP